MTSDPVELIAKGKGMPTSDLPDLTGGLLANAQATIENPTVVILDPYLLPAFTANPQAEHVSISEASVVPYLSNQNYVANGMIEDGVATGIVVFVSSVDKPTTFTATNAASFADYDPSFLNNQVPTNVSTAPKTVSPQIHRNGLYYSFALVPGPGQFSSPYGSPDRIVSPIGFLQHTTVTPNAKEDLQFVPFLHGLSDATVLNDDGVNAAIVNALACGPSDASSCAPQM